MTGEVTEPELVSRVQRIDLATSQVAQDTWGRVAHAGLRVLYEARDAFPDRLDQVPLV